MKPSHLDYYFWLNSDWAYLGADRLEALARRQNVAIHYKPVDLPDVYARTGGVLLGQRSRERQDYRVAELRRWCRKLGIPVNPHPAHMCPNADQASRLVIAADLQGLPVAALYKAILHAEWCEDRDISSEPTLREIAAARRAGRRRPAARGGRAGRRAALPPVHRRGGRRRRVRLAVVCLCRRAVLGPGPAGNAGRGDRGGVTHIPPQRAAGYAGNPYAMLWRRSRASCAHCSGSISERVTRSPGTGSCTQKASPWRSSQPRRAMASATA